MNNISVIIPTLFPPDTLSNEVAQIARYDGVTGVIVVVNANGNNKDENTIHWRFLGKNKGFTGACNAGAKIAQGNLLLFLNDDCTLSPEALQKMILFLEKNRDMVATQPIVCKKYKVQSTKYRDKHIEQNMTNASFNQTEDDGLGTKDSIENIGFWVDTRIGKANPVRSADKFSSTNFQSSSIDAQHPTPNTQHLNYGLSGTCLLIRKEVFEKMGGFDESFHSYLEDVDLAMRLHKAGYKVAPCLEAEVTHAHMATSSRMGLYKEIQDVKNWWRLILKHPDVFVHESTLTPLLVERLRNVSGLVKKFIAFGF